MRSIAAFAMCFVACAATLPGCGGRSSDNDNRSTTVGQELQDLENARNKGLLTTRAKTDVLRRKSIRRGKKKIKSGSPTPSA